MWVIKLHVAKFIGDTAKDQKPSWPAHLGTLAFAYNAMPHSTTGYQPYQLMFGCKAQTPCDNWLGLSQYNCSESISKDLWVQQQYELVWTTNKWALRSIWQSIQKSAERLNKKLLEIPEGNLILLHDHPEGCKKIQNKYKNEEFVVIGKHPEPNVYCIKPVNGNGPVQTVNWHQCPRSWWTQNGGGLTSPQDNHDGSQVSSFNPKLSTNKSSPDSHGYATCSKGRPPIHSQVPLPAWEAVNWGQHKLRESSFVLGVLANLSGFRTMPESAGQGVVHFYFWYFCGQHLKLAS